MTPAAKLPLAGIRVLDFTWVGAGPLTTRLLADFGADVIKIESTSHPDALRTTPPLAPGDDPLERSGYFANRNANKRSFALDMTRPEARDIVLALAADCDVCAQSFRPGTLERWELGYEQLSVARPDLIYLAMPMLGEWGPYATFSGFGATLVALCGLFDLCGDADRPPVGTGTNYPDHVPNPMHAACAVLAALRHRQRTGEGQRIELSQLESTLNVIGPAIESAADGAPPSREGNRVSYACPHGVFPAHEDDHWIALSVEDDAQWSALEALLDPELTPRGLTTLAERKAREDEIESAVRAWTASRPAEEAIDGLRSLGIAAGPVRSAADLLDRDSELLEQGAFARLDHPVMGETVYSAPTAKLSRTPGTMRTSAPLLGQHTDEICQDLLGFDSATVARLRADGVLR